MSKRRGDFRVDRDLVDHPALRNAAEVRAWLWLLGAAAFKSHVQWIEGHKVYIGRGCLCISVRKLAQKWKWHRRSVERFLNKLRKYEMIGTTSGTTSGTSYQHRVTHITISNYSRYQAKLQGTAPKAGQQAGQQAGQHGPSILNVTNDKEHNEKERARAGPVNVDNRPARASAASPPSPASAAKAASTPISPEEDQRIRSGLINLADELRTRAEAADRAEAEARQRKR